MHWPPIATATGTIACWVALLQRATGTGEPGRRCYNEYGRVMLFGRSCFAQLRPKVVGGTAMLQMPVAGARVDVVEDARDDMSRVATRFTTWVLLSREMDGEERRASHGSRPDLMHRFLFVSLVLGMILY